LGYKRHKTALIRIALTIALLNIVTVVALASSSDGATVKDISFKGNHNLSSEALLNVIITKVGSSLEKPALLSDIQAVISLYNKSGFYFSEVKVDTLLYSADSNDVRIVFSIDEGIRSRIDRINVIGNSAITQYEILSTFQTKTGDYLIPAIFEEDVNNVIDIYGRIGFPFAAIYIKDISLTGDNAGLCITLQVDEGRKVTIDEVVVEGNSTTDDDVIIREARIKLHEIYNSKKIESISKRLRKLNIFSQVDEPEVYSTSYGGGLSIRVAEGKTATFSGIAGYSPSNEGSGTFTGLIDIGMRNLFGTGRKFYVRWSKDERKSQDIHLNYIEPWIFNYPLNISVFFDQRQQDTTYVRRGIKMQADILVDESLTLSGAIGQQSVIPSGNTNKLRQSSAFIAGLEIGYDTRDQLICPLHGIWYSTQYFIEKKRMGEEYTTFQRIGVDLDIFLQIIRRQILHAGLHGKTLSGTGIEIGDLYRFGGTNTFRGYRENQFIGKDVAWTNLEYRLLLASRSFVYIFFDTGYFLVPTFEAAGIQSARDYLIGYGAGIRFETSIGNIGLSFGFGEGDSFYEGKVHLGIINEF
jgi:outer membrane protein insertion porin family